MCGMSKVLDRRVSLGLLLSKVELSIRVKQIRVAIVGLAIGTAYGYTVVNVTYAVAGRMY